MSVGVRESGRSVTMLLSMTCDCREFWTSTVGLSPVTRIVSASAPTCIVMLMVAVIDPVRTTASRLTTLKPGSVNVIE